MLGHSWGQRRRDAAHRVRTPRYASEKRKGGKGGGKSTGAIVLVAMEAARATSVGRSRGETLGIVTIVNVGAVRAGCLALPPASRVPRAKQTRPEDQVCLANLRHRLCGPPRVS